ncbi:MAG: hypothetical protein AAF530_21770 [Pseudomonadota bacterium]
MKSYPRQKILRASLTFALAIAALGVLAAKDAFAQSASGELKGIGQVKVFVTDVNQFSTSCDLDRASIQQAFVEPLSEKGLKIAESSAYWVVIRATTVASDSRGCLTSIDATVLQNTKYFNQATKEERVGRIQHWYRGGLHFSDRDDHRDIINDAFRTLGAGLAQDWAGDQ